MPKEQNISFTNQIHNALSLCWDWFLRASLWIVQIGLMLASSGLDGSYMAAWMPPGLRWTGYVLNTMLDASTSILMYWYGRLQRDPSSAKRERSKWVLLTEGFAVVSSWFLTWRQLLRTLPVIEPEAYRWVAPLSATIIPVFLAGIGYCQSLLARRVQVPETSKNLRKTSESTSGKPAMRKATIADWRKLFPKVNGRLAEMTVKDVEDYLQDCGLEAPSERTLRNWLQIAQEERTA